MSDVETAQSQVDESWQAHDAARIPLRDELREILRSVEGVTGLSPGPGADNLVERFLDFAEFHADTLTTAADARKSALEAEARRDEAIANQPPPEPGEVPSKLSAMSPTEARAWLLGANDTDVRDALNSVLDAVEQREWAVQLMEWARADGTTAQVLTAINEKITPLNPADVPNDPVTGGTGATSTFGGDAQAAADATAEANPENEPAADAPVDEIMAWVGTDVDRARVRYDTETEGAQRPDVLAALVEVLDTAQ